MPQQTCIRVLIADDHPIVREGLRMTLQVFDDLTLVGEAANGAEAIRLCVEVQPDVILMDLLMPVMKGITAIQKLRESHPQVQVIALTSFDQDEMIKAAIQAV